MSYAGFLIRIHGNGDYNIPLKYINEKSYSSTLPVLDMDSYRDGNGVLHRDAIIQVPKVKIKTMPLNNSQVAELWGNIRSRYTSNMEKRVTATVYISELDDYITQSFYIPDVEMSIDEIKGNEILYEPFEIKLDGYGE